MTTYKRWNGSNGQLNFISGEPFVAADFNDCIDETQPPIGSVIAWLKSFTGTPATLPSGWIECTWNVAPLSATGVLTDADSPMNTVVIPNLNGSGGTKRFLRGSTTSGTEATNETHNHGGNTGVNDFPWNYGWNSSNSAARDGHVHTIGSSTSLPSYYEVVWIIRIK